MRITRPHHSSGCGIYAKSIPVEGKAGWQYAKAEAARMIEWLDEKNGHFEGEFKKAFAIAHAQVVESTNPFQFFVVDKEMLPPAEVDPKSRQTLTNFYFEGQAIFNAEVLEAPDTIVRKVPQRKVTKDPKNPLKVEVSMDFVEKTVGNVIDVPEGCMSFPHRTERNMKRKYRIKVRYQYLKKGWLGQKVETFEGWVEGLKAHVIQHETDHFVGKNIHFNK